jgi:hypothetical protein
MLGDSLRLQDSAITTASTRADGGNIAISTTGSQLYLLNGKITTSVQSGVGEGGNISIGSVGHPVEFVILNGSEVRADAFGVLAVRLHPDSYDWSFVPEAGGTFRDSGSQSCH